MREVGDPYNLIKSLVGSDRNREDLLRGVIVASMWAGVCDANVVSRSSLAAALADPGALDEAIEFALKCGVLETCDADFYHVNASPKLLGQEFVGTQDGALASFARVVEQLLDHLRTECGVPAAIPSDFADITDQHWTLVAGELALRTLTGDKDGTGEKLAALMFDWADQGTDASRKGQVSSVFDDARRLFHRYSWLRDHYVPELVLSMGWRQATLAHAIGLVHNAKRTLYSLWTDPAPPPNGGVTGTDHMLRVAYRTSRLAVFMPCERSSDIRMINYCVRSLGQGIADAEDRDLAAKSILQFGEHYRDQVLTLEVAQMLEPVVEAWMPGLSTEQVLAELRKVTRNGG